jgi:hypothetical protein
MTSFVRRLLMGFAIVSLAGCGSGGGPSGEGAPKGIAPAEDRWALTLEISVPEGQADGGQAVNRLVAGQEETASDDFDNAWDVRAFLAGPVKAFFTHEGESGYDAGTETLWQDIRSKDLPKEWTVEVVAEAGRPVKVTWVLPDAEVSCGANYFELQDFDGDLGLTDLCASDSLVYEGDGQPRRFVLRVS